MSLYQKLSSCLEVQRLRKLLCSLKHLINFLTLSMCAISQMENVKERSSKTHIAQLKTFDSRYQVNYPFYMYTHYYNVHTQWLEETLLPYLDKWESSVQSRDGYTQAEKNNMLLSSETLSGIRITSI